MSFDRWWAGFFLEDAEHARLAPDFAAAARHAVLAPRLAAAVAAWQQEPSRFDEPAAGRDAEADDFIRAFDLPGFDRLTAEFLTVGGAHVAVAERRFFRLVTTASYAPVGILWRALGPRRAALLPGRMGNVLLRADEVADAREAVRSCLAGTERNALLSEAQRYCGSRVDAGVVSELLAFLPDGLEQAHRDGLGFLALARPQV